MNLFFGSKEDEQLFVLRDDDHRHLTKVLRSRVGDIVYCTDGSGLKVNGKIIEIGKQNTSLSIIEEELVPVPSAHLHIAIAPTKNASRIEWFLEKSTEIGITKITLLKTSRTEKKNFNIKRGEKIILSAMKQSLRYRLPQLCGIKSVDDLINESTEENKIVAHYHEQNPSLASTIKANQSTLILIGPEGDFVENELLSIANAGFKQVNLGVHRLRTETAGVVACHTFNMVNHG